MGYQLGLRIPDDILAKAREMAEVEGRSLSNLILFALRRHIEQGGSVDGEAKTSVG